MTEEIAASRVRLSAHRPGSDEPIPIVEFPATNRGFQEKSSYRIAKPSIGWALLVDDEPLADAAGDSDSWVWEPGFFAGEVTAELLRADRSRAALFLLDVSPDPAKAGREVFGRMIDEIWDEDPQLVLGSEPATYRVGTLGATQDPWLAFARLRCHGPTFMRALGAVAARPRRALRARREHTPLRLARRVDRRTVVAALRNPSLATFLAGGVPAPALAHARVEVPTVEETLDSAANRCLLALSRSALARARSLLQRLETTVAREVPSDTRASLAPRWPARRRFLERFIADLAALLGRTPFDAVRRPEITAAGLNAISADPTYALAWGRGWRAIRSGVAGTVTDERLWVSPTWEIYERWCFVRLGALLRKALPQLGWARQRRSASADSAVWIGSGKGMHLDLRLQSVFPARIAGAGGARWSISRERIPDIALTVQRDDRNVLFLADAKYRTSRDNVLDAMTTAHIYQDSLRLGPERPVATLLLVPAGGGAPWLEDPAFQVKHRVGVHVLAPGTVGEFPLLLREMLGSFNPELRMPDTPPA